MSEIKRSSLTKKDKKRILRRQDNRCYWCGREFNTAVVKPNNTLYVLIPIWDHYTPFCYTQKSSKKEFIATCARCNLHKSSYIITSKEEELHLREWLIAVWGKGGWLDIDIAIARNRAFQEACEDLKEDLEEDLEEKEFLEKIDEKKLDNSFKDKELL
jgi:hypothetical protein